MSTIYLFRTGEVYQMLQNREILELKKRFKKESCTFTKMCGCYVNANKEKVVNINETFLNLDDEEFYKYLEIAKKTLSGTIGNNLLQLEFNDEEEELDGKQRYLLGLRESALKNPDLLEHLYDIIIENYDYVGNYLILVFHDAYDVITKTNDDLKIDESEEVFQYLLCAICPVNLSKPGLGYREEENRIGARIQDWVVGVPDVGFMFPSFVDRSSDIHSLTYYVRDAKDSHPDFIEALGCGARRTATEEQNCFHAMVKTAIAPHVPNSDDVMIDIQEKLQELVEDKEAAEEDLVILEPEEFTLTTDIIKDVLSETEIPDETIMLIQEHFEEEFKDALPIVKHLVNEKEIEKNNKEKSEEKLRAEVINLKKELKAVEEKEYSDVFVRIRPEAAGRVISQTIDGQKYLLIPVEENDQINLNGVETTV